MGEKVESRDPTRTNHSLGALKLRYKTPFVASDSRFRSQQVREGARYERRSIFDAVFCSRENSSLRTVSQFRVDYSIRDYAFRCPSPQVVSFKNGQVV